MHSLSMGRAVTALEGEAPGIEVAEDEAGPLLVLALHDVGEEAGVAGDGREVQADDGGIEAVVIVASP